MSAVALLACAPGSGDVQETWTFNTHGDVPEPAKDQIDLQESLFPEEAVATSGVTGVTAKIPGGFSLDGFDSVHVVVDGPDLGSPLNLVSFSWPSQDRDDLVVTAKEIATELGLNAGDVQTWGDEPPTSTPMGRGVQVIDDVDGVKAIELMYQEVAPGRAAASVTVLWPRSGQPNG